MLCILIYNSNILSVIRNKTVERGRKMGSSKMEGGEKQNILEQTAKKKKGHRNEEWVGWGAV